MAELVAAELGMIVVVSLVLTAGLTGLAAALADGVDAAVFVVVSPDRPNIVMSWRYRMKTTSLKMPETLAIRLENTARQRGVSKSALVRSALEAYLQADRVEHPESALSQAADLVGLLSGPEDLTTSKDYLRNFGR